MISITKDINTRWKIVGHDNYYFGDDKKLYNIKLGKEVKQTLNCRSVGYWIDRKFYTLNRLKPMIVKINKSYCPF